MDVELLVNDCVHFIAKSFFLLCILDKFYAYWWSENERNWAIADRKKDVLGTQMRENLSRAVFIDHAVPSPQDVLRSLSCNAL